ncbi:MAG: HIT domain-containing protein [Verrucomicrobiales bacterium]|jgi:ATP adenylyltransferase|nr:HIT domain-containing protein [Verrucomicrobiales bacterium]
MEHLWAPWRNSYVSGDQKKPADLFFQIGQSADDEANLVVRRGKSCYVMLNRFPYNAGHALVVPYRPVAELAQLADHETAELWQTVTLTVSALKKAFAPQGFNIGINLGACAGAGLPDHLHVHVVPRWHDDVNFMTATAGTRVHPSELEKIYTQLVATFAAENR